MDNLQGITYHTFEQDPVKYSNYEEAIYRALVDYPATDRLSVIPFISAHQLLIFLFSVICIAGAGRGPLVARCLIAMNRASRPAHVYALEKNPNAWITCVVIWIISFLFL